MIKAGEVIRFPEIERVEEWKCIEDVEADGGNRILFRGGWPYVRDRSRVSKEYNWP